VLNTGVSVKYGRQLIHIEGTYGFPDALFVEQDAFHVPPAGSHLDVLPEASQELTPTLEGELGPCRLGVALEVPDRQGHGIRVTQGRGPLQGGLSPVCDPGGLFVKIAGVCARRGF